MRRRNYSVTLEPQNMNMNPGRTPGFFFCLITPPSQPTPCAMTPDQSSTESIFLLDDPDLFCAVTDLIASPNSTRPTGLDVSSLPTGGTGFTQSRRFRINGTNFNFLLISPENAHPFTFLTLGQRTLNRRVPLIVAVTQAQVLRRDLYPGDIAIVSEAAALPYPALYQNIDPQQPVNSRALTQIYTPKPEVVTAFFNQAIKTTLPQIWQTDIPIIRTGYTKHPTLAGGLDPWAPEQFSTIKEAGIDSLAQTPAGVYEAQHLTPESTIICFNMIKGAADQPDNPEWHRRKNKLLYPAMRLILDIVSNCKDD